MASRGLMLAVLAMGPDRPQNGPPLLKVSHGSNDFGADGLRGLMLAVLALGPDRPQNGPPLLKV